MPLQKTTKSIQLAEGMRDDADRFLVEPPAVLKIENGRFDKTGVIAKRGGYEAETALASPADEILYVDGDLVALDGKTLHKYDGSTWTDVGSPTELSTETQRFRTGEASTAQFKSAIGWGHVFTIEGSNARLYDADTGTLVYTESLSGVANTTYDTLPNTVIKVHPTQALFYVFTVPGTGSSAEALRFDLTGYVTKFSLDQVTSSTYPELLNNPAILVHQKTAINGGVFWGKAAFELTATHVYYAWGTRDDVTFDPNFRLTKRDAFTGALVDSWNVDLSTRSGAFPTNIPSGIEEMSGLAIGVTENILGAPFVTAAWGVATHDEYYIARFDANDIASGPVFELTPTVSNKTEPAVFLYGDVVEAPNGDTVMGVSYLERTLGIYTTRFYRWDDNFSFLEEREYQNTLLTSDFVGHSVDKVVLTIQEPTAIESTEFMRDPNDSGPGGEYVLGDLPITWVDTRLQKPDTTLFCTYGSDGLVVKAALGVDSSKSVPGIWVQSCRSGNGIQNRNGQWWVCNPEMVTPPVGFYRLEDTAATVSVGELFYDSASLGSVVGRVSSLVIDDTSVGVEPLNNGILYNSTVPIYWDNRVFSELTPRAPEVRSLLPSLPQGEAGNVIQAVIGYTDSDGNLHRSAASQISYFSGTFTSVSVRYPHSITGNRVLYIYVSDAGGVPGLYQQIPLEGTDAGAVTVNITTSADYAQVTGETIYSAAELDNTVLPQFKDLVNVNGRLWAASESFPGTIYYSKLLRPGLAPEFGLGGVIELGTQFEITGIGGLDDKTVIFSADKIVVVYGDGPNDAGIGPAFALHDVVTDAGCINRLSIVETPRGLLFQSRRGIHMIDRSMNVVYVGGGLEDIFREASPISATLVPTDTEVRYLLERTNTLTTPAVTDLRPDNPSFGTLYENGDMAVFNYEKNAWSIYKNLSGSSDVVAEGDYYILRTDGAVWKSSALFSDDGVSTTNRVTIESPWIKVRNVQEFSRIYRATFIGRYYSDYVGGETPDIFVDVYYDYEDNPVNGPDAYTFPVDDLLINEGDPERMQFSFVPGRQKCQSIKFIIREGNGGGRGFEITSVDLEFGVKNVSSRSGRGQ